MAAMWLTGRIGLAIESQAAIRVIPLWLPSGVALGGLFLLGWVGLPFVWLGAFLISASVRVSPLAIVFATGDLLSAWLGWWLLTRLRDFDNELARARDVVVFVLFGAVIGTLPSMLIGVLAQAIAGVLAWRAVPNAGLTWWLGDLSGVLVSAPLLLRWNRSWWKQLQQEGRTREAMAGFGAIGVLILVLIFAGGSEIAGGLWRMLSWLLLLWAALRFGSLGAPSAVFLLTVGNIVEFLQSMQGAAGNSQRVLWDQWVTTMALSVAGLLVMVLEAARQQTDDERAGLQAKLAQAQKLESVGRLAGGIAHDFNNLLTVINGYSKLALRKLAGEDPVRRQMAQILRAGERAAGLTRQLLAFSRQQVLDPQVVDLNGVLEGIHPMIESLMSDNVEVDLRLHGQPLPVWADVHQLEQIVLNLAVNARDSMASGGRLSIGTDLAEWGEETPRAKTSPGSWAVMAVSDTGTGMDEATREKIFEPFFTTKEKGKGTGLGLSIVQEIVAQSGGHIDVASRPNRGTIFRVYLPLQPAEKIHREEPESRPLISGKETILLVEDWPDVRQYVSETLRSYGYQVVAAADASEAMTLTERATEPFDLVVTDVVMNGMSGVALAARLAASQPKLKTLFMSGYSDQSRPQSALPQDANFLQKPFSPEQLAEKIQSILANS